MNNYSIILLSFVLLISGCEKNKQKDKSKPNIILILTDDQGYLDVGFNGSNDILTPNIDNLAREGIVFSNGYVTHPYCSPSRAGIMTGRYQQRFGHEHNVPFNPDDINLGTPLNEILLSDKMKSLGYNTYAIGKWHLGDNQSFLPHKRGFDKWFGFSGGSMNYWGNPSKKGRMQIQRNDSIIESGNLTYLTDDFTNEALSNIRNNGDKPFFMFLSYNAPHSPDQTTIEHLKKTNHIEFGKRSVYGAMISAIDHGIGKINTLLSEMNIKDNTMIIFLSDNGGRLDVANNGPFRGHKGMLFEGGIRVPFAISWPSRLKKNMIFDEPIISLDLFTTCMAAAGLIAKESYKLDGINLLPYLEEKTNNKLQERNLFWRVANGKEYAIRKGKYKLIKSAYKNKIMLFDLENDKMETNDISKSNPNIVSELSSLYSDWNSQLAIPLWSDPHIENIIKEENQYFTIRKKSLSKNEQKYFD